MNNVSHENVIKCLNHSIDGIAKKLILGEYKEKQCVYIVLELAPNGELFDFIKPNQLFKQLPENIAR